MKNIKSSALVFLLALIFAACSSDDSSDSKGVETGAPQIVSLTANKTQILYGGNDPAIITCVATGGNLTYSWEVDLGDIVPLNSDHSKVQFTGAACCVGEKTIKCTVSNSQGKASQTIVITILEQNDAPQIINVESDKSILHIDSSQSANIVCYATGGSLKYKWSAECGAISYPYPSDSSKISYLPSESCIGYDYIKCIVNNSKGVASDSVKITVVH